MLEKETAVGVDSLVAEADGLRKRGARMVTATGLDEGDHFDVIYSFVLDGQLQHLRLSAGKQETVPSISEVFPGAFLIENEMKELLGVQITGISVDYGGKLFLVEGSPERPLAKPLSGDGSGVMGVGSRVSADGKPRPPTPDTQHPTPGPEVRE